MIRFMPDKDPMEELFRRSANNLEQRPSLRGWHKLEQKLDANRNRASRRQLTQGYLKPWYYAAAAVALVIILMVGLGKVNAIDQKVLAKAPESIEELGDSQQIKQTIIAATYQSIPEGSRADVLTVRNSSIPRLMPAERYRL